MFRFSVKWRRGVLRKCRFRPSGGDFQGIWVFRSDEGWKKREKLVLALLVIVSMSPPGYPSAWLHPCRARFRFTRHDHCSSMGHDFKPPVDGPVAAFPAQ